MVIIEAPIVQALIRIPTWLALTQRPFGWRRRLAASDRTSIEAKAQGFCYVLFRGLGFRVLVTAQSSSMTVSNDENNSSTGVSVIRITSNTIPVGSFLQL